MAAPASSTSAASISVARLYCADCPPFHYKEEAPPSTSNAKKALLYDTYTLNPQELDLKRTHVCVVCIPQLVDRVGKIFTHFEKTFFPPNTSKNAEFDVAIYSLSCKTPNSSPDVENCMCVQLYSFPSKPGYEFCLQVIANANGMQAGHVSQELLTRAKSYSRIFHIVIPEHDNLLVLTPLPKKLPASDTDLKTN